jgi:hypothetical protein
LKHLTMLGTLSPDLNEVRVWGAKLPELFSFFWYSLERKLVVDHSGPNLYETPDDLVYRRSSALPPERPITDHVEREAGSGGRVRSEE